MTTLPQLSNMLSRLPGVNVKNDDDFLRVTCDVKSMINVVSAAKNALPILRLANFFATDDRVQNQTFGLWIVLAADAEHFRILINVAVPENEPHFPTLSEIFVNSARFERDIWDMFGIVPDNHPELKPVNAHDHWPQDFYPLRKNVAWNTKVAPTPGARPYAFKRYEGEGIYEIPVGPIHAGVIEPGHFRFQVAGEPIQNLEIRLGWKHRGVEKLFENLPLEKTVHLSEQVSGDASFAHSAAFCMAVEKSAGVNIPERTQMLRMILLELERLGMHLHDLANMSVGIAFNFGASQLWILREQLLELNTRLTGSRFLRGMNRFGGLQKDLLLENLQDITETLQRILPTMNEVVKIITESPSCMDRLQTTGVLPAKIAHDLGAVGIAARCTGLNRDVRKNFPYLQYANVQFTTPLAKEADVLARFLLRQKEIAESEKIIQQCMEKLHDGAIATDVAVQPNTFGYASIETNRGELQYVVMTNANGNFHRVKICDPAFHNWDALAWCVLGNIVPDFPICNKSFNLSYSGHDL